MAALHGVRDCRSVTAVDEWIGPAGERGPAGKQVLPLTGEALRERRKRLAEERAARAATRSDEELGAEDDAEGDDAAEDDEHAGDGVTEQATKALEAPAGPAVPRGTSTTMPADEFARLGQPQSLAWIKTEITRKAEWLRKRSVTAPLRLISAWWAGPRVAPGSALPISWQKELLERPFPDGTYYVSFRTVEGEEHPSDEFYVVRIPGASAEEPTAGGADPALKFQIAQGRAIESLEHTNLQQKKRIDELTSENTSLRETLNELRDDLAAAERTVRAQEAEIESLKAKGEPLFDEASADELGVKAVEAFRMWLEDPDKAALKIIEAQRALMLQQWDFMKAMFSNDNVVLFFLHEQRDLYDQLVAMGNDIAEAGEQPERFLSAGDLLQRLPPPEEEGSEDEVLDALKLADAEMDQLRAELEEARARATKAAARVKQLGHALREAEETIESLLPKRPGPRKVPAPRKATKPKRPGLHKAQASQKVATKPKRRTR